MTMRMFCAKCDRNIKDQELIFEWTITDTLGYRNGNHYCTECFGIKCRDTLLPTALGLESSGELHIRATEWRQWQ